MVAPLHSKVEAVVSRRGRRKTQLAGVDLDWTPVDVAAFRAVVTLRTTSSKQYFADADATAYMFSDALISD